jgi:hypothetical protein
LTAFAAAARAEIVFQHREDVRIGSGPTAVALVAGSPPLLLVSNADGLAAFHYEDGILEHGGRSPAGRGVPVLTVGPIGDGRALTVAYGGRDASRIALAPIDSHGAVGAPELVPLPALPRLARAADLGRGAHAAAFVAHDRGLSILVRGPDTWQRDDLAISDVVRDFAVADLDGDGTADIAAVEEGHNDVVVFHGSGDGRFATPTRITSVRRPRRVVIADVNGDRRPDILVIGDDGLAVHFGQANGFSSPQRLEGGDQLADVAVADVNGDGRADLALLDRGRSTLNVLFGDEGGRFRNGDCYLVGSGAEMALLADLDGDGRIDAVTFNRLADNATILRGRGGGAFDGIRCLRADVGDLTAIVADDFDGDEHPDLAVASEDGGKLGVFLSIGNGQFRALPPIVVGRQPRALVAGDFNQDDIPDLAAVNFGGDTVTILLGDGHGGFGPPRTVGVGTGPTAISVGSFSSDTSTDLAVVNGLSDSVSVLYGDGHGQFPTVATFPVGARPSFLIVGDTNRDGHQDLVVGSQFSESIAILLGDGHQLAAPTTNKLSGTARPSIAEDFDGDGQMDLVNIDEAAGSIEILPGTGPGTFGTPIRLSVGRDPHAVALGDFDRDGRIDIAVAHRATQTVAILLNRSAAKTTAPIRAPRAGDANSKKHS